MSETASTGKKVSYVGVLTAIYAAYFLIPDTGYISPALGNIALVTGASADLVSYLSTLPSLAQIASALIASFVAGKYIKNRTLLIWAIAGLTIFGIAPAFMSPDAPFELMLATRFMLGFFLGFLMPIINTAIAHVFQDEGKRANVYGRANMVFNIGSVFGLMVGGIAASYAWNGSFWLYGVGVIAFVVVLIFYKEDETSMPMAELRAQAKAEKVKVPGFVYFMMVLQLLAMTFDMTFFSMIPSAFMYHQLGDPAVIGTLMSAFTAVGIVVSLLFGPIFGFTKKWTLIIGAFLAALGMAVLYLGLTSFEALTVVFIATAILGIGHTVIGLSIIQIISTSVLPYIMVAAMGFYKVFMDLGNFASSPFISTVTAAFQIPPDGDFSIIFAVACVGMIVTGVVAVFVCARIKPIDLSQTPDQAVELPTK